MGSVIWIFSFIDKWGFLNDWGKILVIVMGFAYAFGQGLVRGVVLEFEGIVKRAE